jgi:DNA-binding PadR family transcriptional regulator
LSLVRYRDVACRVWKVGAMYRDNSLIPKEAIRMAALGALINGSRSYIDISTEVRQFSARIVGPSLDLLGTSIELLKLEGLIEVVENPGGDGEELLRLTTSGFQELKEYLRSTIRSGSSDLNKLVVALKLRFIEVLEPSERLDQLVGLQTMYQAERNRLQDLRKHKEWSAGLLPGLLDLELAVTDQRLSWCGEQVEKIEKLISSS